MKPLLHGSLSLAILLASAAVVGGCAATPSDDDDTRGQAAANSEGVQTPIEAVSNVAYARGELTFGYRIGGGCAQHTPKATAEFVPDAVDLAAMVTVKDVASAPDPCEALLYPEGKVSLPSLLKTAAAQRTGSDEDLSGQGVTVTLPWIEVEVGQATNAPAPSTGRAVRAVDHVDADGSKLKFGYGTAGGCAQHTASTRVTFQDGGNGLVIAKLSVEDVGPPDFCEAFISVEGAVDLPSLLANESARAGRDLGGKRVVVELPAVNVTM